jgi:hypothetical protein
MLQVSEAEESIRHAIISIGALDMTVAPSHRIGYPGQATKGVSQRQLFALEQYSKAIKELRRKVFISEYDLRTVLIASILIICFETFHQNYESAASQIRTAVKLIEYKRNDIGSRNDVEQDLLCTFDRLDIQTMSRTNPHVDLFTIDEHLALKESGADFMAGMPDEFEDIATARNYLYNMIRRHAHFKFVFRKTQAMARVDPSLQQQAYATDESVLQERVKSIEEKWRWMDAFEPLFTKHRTPEERRMRTREFLAVSVMRIHLLIVMVTPIHMFETSELHFDKSLPVFTEMVDLCEDVLGPENGEGARVFVFEMQTLMALDNIAKKCRDPFLRRRAVALLRRRPMREGVRDSMLSAKVGEWVIGVEEEGMVDGFIGEESRTRDVSVTIEDGGQTARVSCWVGVENRSRRERIIAL